jgi:2-methylisocitrate lyase-like PEP mutase family enzyme
MTGSGVSVGVLGHPDIGLTTMTEMRDQAALLCRQLHIPLIADADTGFGDVTNVFRTVAEFQRAGVAAVQLEDQVSPKRCGHLDGKSVTDAGEFIDKIQAAAEARGNSDLVLIARTDARATDGFAEAIRRARAYAAAGADVIFVEAPQTVDEIRAIPKEVEAPVLFNYVTGGKTPKVPLDDLQAFGYRLVIVPGICIGAAAPAIEDALSALRGGSLQAGRQSSPTARFNAVGLEFWTDLRERYTRGNAR